MSTDNTDLFTKVYSTLDGNEPMGVNQIARVIGAAPSSVDRLLKSRKGQHVFSQLDSKKWTLTGSIYTEDKFPLDEGDSIPPNVVKWIESPLDYVPAISSAIRDLRAIADIKSRQAEFLYRMLENALKKVR